MEASNDHPVGTKTATSDQPSRREFLQRAGAVGLSAAALGGALDVAHTSPVAAATTNLKVLFADSGGGLDSFTPMQKYASAHTGYHVSVNSNPYNGLEQKAYSELGAGSSFFDNIEVDVPWSASIGPKLQPLTEYILDSSISDPSVIAISDFIPNVFLDTCVYDRTNTERRPPAMDTIDPRKLKSLGFEIIGLPLYANAETISYRQDVFDKARPAYREKYGKDLTFPDTWDEYVQIAQFLTKPPYQYGTALYGGKTEAVVWDWGVHFYQRGGQLFDADLNPLFNNQEGVAALQELVDWIYKLKIAPVASTAYSWPEMGDAFSSGLIVMAHTWTNLPLSSSVAAAGGKVSYHQVPGFRRADGTIDKRAHFGTWQLSVNSYGKNKIAAYKNIEWVTSAGAQLAAAGTQLHATRRSFFKSTKALAASGYASYYTAMEKALEIAFGRPRLRTYPQWTQVMQTQLNAAVTRTTSVKQALDTAVAQTAALMKMEKQLAKKAGGH